MTPYLNMNLDHRSLFPPVFWSGTRSALFVPKVTLGSFNRFAAVIRSAAPPEAGYAVQLVVFGNVLPMKTM